MYGTVVTAGPVDLEEGLLPAGTEIQVWQKVLNDPKFIFLSYLYVSSRTIFPSLHYSRCGMWLSFVKRMWAKWCVSLQAWPIKTYVCCYISFSLSVSILGWLWKAQVEVDKAHIILGSPNDWMKEAHPPICSPVQYWHLMNKLFGLVYFWGSIFYSIAYIYHV